MSKTEPTPTNPPSDPIAELAARLAGVESGLRELGPVLVNMAESIKGSTEGTEQRFDLLFSRMSDLMLGVERIGLRNEIAQRAAPTAAPTAAPGISVLDIGATPGDVVLTPGGSAPEASAVGVPAVAVTVSGKRELGNAQTVIDI